MSSMETIYEPGDYVYTMSNNGRAIQWIVRADGTLQKVEN